MQVSANTSIGWSWCVWQRATGSGMGLVYCVGNLGKFIGPAGLALIAGSSNYVKPQATLDALIGFPTSRDRGRLPSPLIGLRST
jgi:hypothetical protein